MNGNAKTEVVRSEGTKFLGMEFAPLKGIPLERRIQTLMVLYGVFEFTFGLLSSIFLISLLWTRFYYVAILYSAWMYYDRDTPCKGGRPFRLSRKNPTWKYYTDYFPMTLEKTADLDPKENYIIGYHPHGIIATGAFGNFASDATGFDKLFPGLNPWLVTLKVNFWFPFYRELVLMRGLVDSSKESINWLLQKCGKGNAVIIVVGGAAESLNAVPNTMRLTLKSRKGFVRLALQNGASLVPVISFGENELYTQSDHQEGSLVRKIQQKAKELLTFTFPVIHGRGVFQYTMGILPYRIPIHTIVGKPIPVTKVESPTQEQVNTLHQTYIQGLKELFNTHKAKYAQNPELEMILQ